MESKTYEQFIRNINKEFSYDGLDKGLYVVTKSADCSSLEKMAFSQYINHLACRMHAIGMNVSPLF